MIERGNCTVTAFSLGEGGEGGGNSEVFLLKKLITSEVSQAALEQLTSGICLPRAMAGARWACDKIEPKAG